jgi:hypothetical protein
VRRAEEFEVTLVSPDASEARETAIRTPALRVERAPVPYLKATDVVAMAIAAALSVDRVFPVASLALVFLTEVILVPSRHGLWPSLYAATVSFFAYNFLFTDPRLTFHMARQDEILTLLLFYVASIITRNLAAQLRRRAEAQRAIADQTNTLYDFSRKVASAASFDDVVWAAVTHVSATLKPDSCGGRRGADPAVPPDRARGAWPRGGRGGYGAAGPQGGGARGAGPRDPRSRPARPPSLPPECLGRQLLPDFECLPHAFPRIWWRQGPRRAARAKHLRESRERLAGMMISIRRRLPE